MPLQSGDRHEHVEDEVDGLREQDDEGVRDALGHRVRELRRELVADRHCGLRQRQR